MQRKNHEDLINEIYTELNKDMPKSHIRPILKAMTNVIASNLKMGNEIKIANIGNFIPFTMKARAYRNVKTGNAYIKKEHVTVKCRIAKPLKDTVK